MAKKRSKKKKRLVFISHSSQDTWVAEQIGKRIKASGGDFFLDQSDIQAGADFEEQIIKNLNRSDELLVLLTPWALKRPYVWAELGIALGRRLLIVGVLHGLSPANLYKKGEAPVFLKKKNLIELNQIEKYFVQLRSRAKKK